MPSRLKTALIIGISSVLATLGLFSTPASAGVICRDAVTSICQDLDCILNPKGADIVRQERRDKTIERLRTYIKARPEVKAHSDPSGAYRQFVEEIFAHPDKSEIGRRLNEMSSATRGYLKYMLLENIPVARPGYVSLPQVKDETPWAATDATGNLNLAEKTLISHIKLDNVITPAPGEGFRTPGPIAFHFEESSSPYARAYVRPNNINGNPSVLTFENRTHHVFTSVPLDPSWEIRYVWDLRYQPYSEAYLLFVEDASGEGKVLKIPVDLHMNQAEFLQLPSGAYYARSRGDQRPIFLNPESGEIAFPSGQFDNWSTVDTKSSGTAEDFRFHTLTTNLTLVEFLQKNDHNTRVKSSLFLLNFENNSLAELVIPVELFSEPDVGFDPYPTIQSVTVDHMGAIQLHFAVKWWRNGIDQPGTTTTTFAYSPEKPFGYFHAPPQAVNRDEEYSNLITDDLIEDARGIVDTSGEGQDLIDGEYRAHWQYKLKDGREILYVKTFGRPNSAKRILTYAVYIRPSPKERWVPAIHNALESTRAENETIVGLLPVFGFVPGVELVYKLNFNRFEIWRLAGATAIKTQLPGLKSDTQVWDVHVEQDGENTILRVYARDGIYVYKF